MATREYKAIDKNYTKKIQACIYSILTNTNIKGKIKEELNIL